MNATRLTYTAAQVAKIETCRLQELQSDQLRVRALYSGISRGTESLVYHGLVPPSEYTRMQCPHQHGEFSFPIAYGYANVGIIEEIGTSLNGFEVGDRVFSLHPHQDIYNANANFCTKLPDDLRSSRAVLAANMETALNGVWDAELPETGAFCVIGAGVVGLLTAYLVRRLSGIIPTLIDINPTKQKIAEALGLQFLPANAVDSIEMPPQSRIFNTSASGKGLQTALDIADFEAKIIEMSWYGEKQVTLNLGGAFHSKRLSIISSQVGHVSPTRRATTSHADRMAKAMEYLQDPVLDNLLEPEIQFETLPSRLHEIFSNKSDALCQLVKYKNEQ